MRSLFIAFFIVAMISIVAVATSVSINSKNKGSVVITDPLLKTEVQMWVAVMKHHDVLHSKLNRLEEISWGKSTGHAGVSASNKIIIDPSLRGDITKLRFTLWHELGHAVYKLSHSSGIMSEELPDSKFIKVNWWEFREDYITKCKKNQYHVY